jgi:5-methylcytosine-specific restriction enzyme subunit McrC
MIDREQPKRAEKSDVQASDRRCGWPSGLLPAVGGLPHPAKRRIIGVREPPYGKCRVKGPDLPNLLAKVLIGGTQHLLRRGLDRGYKVFEEDTGRLRGRIMIGETIGRALLPQARARCQYEELSYDILHNHILRSTITLLADADAIDGELRHELRNIDRALDGITTVRLSNEAFRRVQLYSNNAFYAFLMRVCALVRDALIPEERSGRFRFREVVRDETRMAAIFQNFVLNFLGYDRKLWTGGEMKGGVSW